MDMDKPTEKGWAGWWDLAGEKGWKDVIAKHPALNLNYRWIYEGRQIPRRSERVG